VVGREIPGDAMAEKVTKAEMMLDGAVSEVVDAAGISEEIADVIPVMVVEREMMVEERDVATRVE
jgi:hypothetical protein